MIQEIHLSDTSLRSAFVQDWKDNDYESCISILQNAQLNNKKLIADVFNDITSNIIILENNSDSSFKADRIVVSVIAPTGLSSGSVWFEEIV